MQPLRTIKKPFKLTRPLWKQLLKNIYTGSFAEKNLRIFFFFFSENVVIGQSSSKCPGLSVRTVKISYYFFQM